MKSQRGPAARVHDLKCWPPHWDAINSGQKRVDVRKDDRGFRVGDVLVLREWVMAVRESVPVSASDWEAQLKAAGAFTGQVCQRTVTHVLPGGQFGIAEGYVVLSLRSSDEPQQ